MYSLGITDQLESLFSFTFKGLGRWNLCCQFIYVRLQIQSGKNDVLPIILSLKNVYIYQKTCYN